MLTMLFLVIVQPVGSSIVGDSNSSSNDGSSLPVGGYQAVLFKKLAAEKEGRLKELLDKSTKHGKTACRNFRSSIQEDEGKIAFDSYGEVDTSPAGAMGIFRFEIGWRVKYSYKNGGWEYVSSEREVWNDQGQLQGWSSGDTSHNETDMEIVRALR